MTTTVTAPAKKTVARDLKFDMADNLLSLCLPDVILPHGSMA
jgi:hypothetical protein